MCTRRWLRFGGLFDLEVLEARPGYLMFLATGSNAMPSFRHEAGGHRWQRVPPTEKRGRVQTSTVTVVVLRESTESQIVLEDRDLEFKTCRGSGAGGQHRNKTDTAVQLTHLPTGLQVRVEAGRSQHQNKQTAKMLLAARLQEAEDARSTDERNAKRRDQVGSGMRGDKRRTIAVQRDQVVDHVTNKSISVKAFLRGQLDGLWP